MIKKSIKKSDKKFKFSHRGVYCPGCGNELYRFIIDKNETIGIMLSGCRFVKPGKLEVLATNIVRCLSCGSKSSYHINWHVLPRKSKKQ